MSLSKICRRIYSIISAPHCDPYFRDIVLGLDCNGLNNTLNNEVNNLKIVLKAELPKMIIQSDSVFDEKEIENTENVDEVRFIIHDHYKTPSGTELCKKNSHVLEIITSTNDDDITTSFDYKFYTTDDSFVYIIIDVMLDIQMFYYHGLDKRYDTVEKKREFSLMKVDFCKHLPLGKRFDHTNSFNNYCSFAFYCRQLDNSFDYSHYIKMWADFTKELYGDISHSGVCELANEIIKDYPCGEQLSYRKLINQLKQCEQGETYELIRIRKRPKTKYSKQKISALFGTRKLRVGMIKVVPLRMKYQYIKHKRFIEIFEFVA